MTSLNNPVKLPLDANGNVLANINAQNINPNVGSITNPPLRHKFITTLITTTTSTTLVTLGTYTSNNGIGQVLINYYNSTTAVFALYNGSTNLGQVQTTSSSYVLNTIGYNPQGAVTLTLAGYVGSGTGYYVITVYEVL